MEWGGQAGGRNRSCLCAAPWRTLLPGPAAAAGGAAGYFMSDGPAVAGIPGDAVDDPAVVVVGEDGTDSFVGRYLVGLEAGTEAEGAVIFPD